MNPHNPHPDPGPVSPDQDQATPSARNTVTAQPGRPTSGPSERLAYSVDEAAELTGLSRDLLYDETPANLATIAGRLAAGQ